MRSIALSWCCLYLIHKAQHRCLCSPLIPHIVTVCLYFVSFRLVFFYLTFIWFFHGCFIHVRMYTFDSNQFTFLLTNWLTIFVFVNQFLPLPVLKFCTIFTQQWWNVPFATVAAITNAKSHPCKPISLVHPASAFVILCFSFDFIFNFFIYIWCELFFLWKYYT